MSAHTPGPSEWKPVFEILFKPRIVPWQQNQNGLHSWTCSVWDYQGACDCQVPS